ncbi:MAG TPA: TonB-dependent receptor, partial [Chitinophagaceae bacterium]|nr:TonB-dependent receptor [Chitinophagaceae bacterium]
MNLKCIPALLCAMVLVVKGYSQEDTLPGQTLGEIIISANKWEQKLNEVPNKISKISKLQILRNNPQTAADLLSQTGTVFVQKSQLGGGSPMIRGFATNRVLLVVDGVRMNNAIYRSGNLQNVISIDALSTETAEVIFGPGSLIYGSDAIGGVMDFHSLEARLSRDSNRLVRGSGLARYSTANHEKTLHADLNFGKKKWAWLGAITYSSFDDLVMGKYGGQDSYLRPEYVIRQGNTDRVVTNNKPRKQRFSGYDQLNLIQKLRFRPAANWEFQYSFTYAGTSDAPRYDRLIQYRNGALRFAEWYYGPMLWRMHNFQVLNTGSGLYDEVRMTLAYQDYQESRVDRALNSTIRHQQTEKVDAVSLNWDALKKIGGGQLYYGLEYVYNKVGSAGEKIDITDGSVTPFVSRYPDGSSWNTSGIYASYRINIHPKFTLSGGLRYNYNNLKARFDTSFIDFPFRDVKLNHDAITGSMGMVYRPAEGWQINGNISTGYRMPNVDDIGKLFESEPGNIIVPNPGLQPEYAWNFEIGIIKKQTNKFRLELNGFHTLLNDAIVRRPSRFDGLDSIFFEGAFSRVESLQNVAKARIWGFQGSLQFFLDQNWSLQTHANWIRGKETDDEKDEEVPLRHAPPFYGNTSIRFRFQKLYVEGTAIYNSQVL